MKCDEAIRDILLDSSGELDPAVRPRLAAHLEQCASCRSYRDTLTRVEMVVQEESRAEAVASAVTADTILTEMTRRSAISPRRVPWSWLTQPAWSAVAAMVVAFLVGFTGAMLWDGLRPASPVGPAMAPAASSAVWSLDEWMDLQIDLLWEEAAALARDLQRPMERPPEAAEPRESDVLFDDAPVDV